jgi:putative endonuclease
MGRVGWCVYILRCGDGTLYTGATNDLPARLARHAAGRGARYTRGRGPLEVALVLPARGRGAALRREAAVKRMARGEKLAMIAAGARGEGRGRRGLRRRG